MRHKFYNLHIIFFIGLHLMAATAFAQQMTTGGKPAQLDIRKAGEHSIRVTLKPLSFTADFPSTPALAEKDYPPPVISIQKLEKSFKKKIGSLQVELRPGPLTLIVKNDKHELIQQLVFEEDGNLSFSLNGQPVLGMGEGGPKPERGADWRSLPIQYNRLGALDKMEPRWQSDAYGSRNPVAMLAGTAGWGLFVATPWVQVDLRDKSKGFFIPWQPAAADSIPQNEKNQELAQGKGLPPVNQIVPGLYDFFVFDAHEPQWLMKDFSAVTGPAVLPPKWALGYMQSHRTLQDDQQMMGIIDTFRSRKIPVDAVIYLGTGFTPRGWNTTQPSFDFNPEVFKRDPAKVISGMHGRNVKVVLHMVPWDRDKLPTLQGNIPARQGEKVDASHLLTYWKQHEGLIHAGTDAFWPDEGDWFNLFERIRRHQLYYQGPLYTQPNKRPWSLHRNGFPGIAQWGGWVWSGDTESSWKTLEGQVAVGINYSLSISPFWGSDIGGFYANSEKTGELYARWFQFGAFCASFRSHGRTWMTSLPWGWGLADMGPKENNNNNTDTAKESKRNILQSEMNNPLIEPVAKKYAELRYQLMPYTYTLAWQARQTGMPLMRAMWLHYPLDTNVQGMGSQYLWGRDLLIAPVFKKGATSRDVYLPKGFWYDWWTNEKVEGGKTVNRAVDLATMPIYIRAGSIIPVDPIRQYTDEPVTEPTTLKIYSGASGSFTLYEDDGKSQDYLKGKVRLTKISWSDVTKTLRIEPGSKNNYKTGKTKRAFIVELIPGGIKKHVYYVAQTLSVILK